MAEDTFRDTQTIQNDSVITPALEWFNITPSDTIELARLPKAIVASGAGVIRVKSQSGAVADFTVAPGVPLPVRPQFVMQSGTTGTGIVGLV